MGREGMSGRGWMEAPGRSRAAPSKPRGGRRLRALRVFVRSALLLVAQLHFSVAAFGASDSSSPHPPPPGPKDKCAVCGMFVAKYPEWVAAAVLADGKVRYFDGPKDLFRYSFDVERYERGRSREDVKGLFVTEYYSTRLVPAESVFFVAGSDVLGPMGHELVPVEGQAAAKTFSADHRGRAVLAFGDVTPDALSGLQ